MDERKFTPRDTGQSRPQYDLSAEFAQSSDGMFYDRLDEITREAPTAEIIIRVPLEALSANVFENRFKRFKLSGGRATDQQRRRFIIQNATAQDREQFKTRFMGAEWE